MRYIGIPLLAISLILGFSYKSFLQTGNTLEDIAVSFEGNRDNLGFEWCGDRFVGSLRLKLKSIGDVPITTDFRITVFDDSDEDQFPDPAEVHGSWMASTIGVSLPINDSTLITLPRLEFSQDFGGDLIWIWVDSDEVMSEYNEANNLINTGQICWYRPPVVNDTLYGGVQFQWKMDPEVDPVSRNVHTTPMVANLDDDNHDGKIDHRDIPEIIFMTNDTSGAPPDSIDPKLYAKGTLRAIHGHNGSKFWSVSRREYPVAWKSQPAVGDIHPDYPGPEIIVQAWGHVQWPIPDTEHDSAFTNTSRQLYCFSAEGEHIWTSDSMSIYLGLGAPSLADLNADGTPEVIMGNIVLDNMGKIIWDGNKRGIVSVGQNGVPPLTGPLSCVADINMDGYLDVVCGNAVFNYDGTLQWVNRQVPDGYNAIGNFDDDLYPEIAIVFKGRMYLLNHDGTQVWSNYIEFPRENPSDPKTFSGGPPIIGDFNFQPSKIFEREIGTSSSYAYNVVTPSGATYSFQMIDFSSAIIGSTVFDFDGDGQGEVVIRDETNLYILNGINGTIRFKTRSPSGTLIEYPVIADVDKDNRAEIVIGVNDHGKPLGTADHGLVVYGDIDGQWTSARPIWNQHTYHVTNINDDGTIPRRERISWSKSLNTYRCQVQQSGELPKAYMPDVCVANVKIDDRFCPDSLHVMARIGNGGWQQVHEVFVSNWMSTDNINWTLLDSEMIPGLKAGQYQDVKLVWNLIRYPRNPSLRYFIRVMVELNDQYTDCTNINNSCSIGPMYICPMKADSQLPDSYEFCIGNPIDLEAGGRGCVDDMTTYYWLWDGWRSTGIEVVGDAGRKFHWETDDTFNKTRVILYTFCNNFPELSDTDTVNLIAKTPPISMIDGPLVLDPSDSGLLEDVYTNGACYDRTIWYDLDGNMLGNGKRITIHYTGRDTVFYVVYDTCYAGCADRDTFRVIFGCSVELQLDSLKYIPCSGELCLRVTPIEVLRDSTYYWDWGDGTGEFVTKQEMMCHKYDRGGLYIVKVFYSGRKMDTGTLCYGGATKDVYLLVQKPQMNLTLISEVDVSSDTIRCQKKLWFRAWVYETAGGGPFTYQWNLYNDETVEFVTTVDTQFFLIEHETPYTLSVTATDSIGCAVVGFYQGNTGQANINQFCCYDADSLYAPGANYPVCVKFYDDEVLFYCDKDVYFNHFSQPNGDKADVLNTVLQEKVVDAYLSAEANPIFNPINSPASNFPEVHQIRIYSRSLKQDVNEFSGQMNIIFDLSKGFERDSTISFDKLRIFELDENQNIWRMLKKSSAFKPLVTTNIGYAGKVFTVMEYIPPDELCSNIANYPNPFNPYKGNSTNITYVLTEDSKVTLEIFTVTGGLVWKREMLSGEIGGEGEEYGFFNAVQWDGYNMEGRIVAPGTYIMRLKAVSSINSWECEALHKIAVVN